jgi:hypothetical protein
MDITQKQVYMPNGQAGLQKKSKIEITDYSL